MKNPIKFLCMIFLIVSCSGNDDGDMNNGRNNPPPPPENTPNAVRLNNNSTFGNVLTDAAGKSLYFFSMDAAGQSNCDGTCLSNWPVFYVAQLTLDSGLASSDFGTITRSGGVMQTTYKGWPLYYYAGDGASGNVNGDGVNDLWYVAKPDYTVMMVRNQLLGRDAAGNETNLTSAYEPGEELTTYMTDAYGNTLYSFIQDTFEDNNFTATDFANNGVWPIFESTLNKVPSIFLADDFGSIDVFGRTQLTYKGWPLYYFGQDDMRGDNYGVGFPSAGIWPIVNTTTELAPSPANDILSYTVTNDGGAAYIFTGGDLDNASNPDLTLVRGKTYEFAINAPGHPFYIKTEQSIGTQNAYNNGVSNNGASTATISFTVPSDAPDTLYYNCEFHSPMTGKINITD